MNLTHRLGRHARHLAAAFACCVPLAAQCCLGAQNVTATSCDGRFRVEAISRTGTGPTSHGPYCFAFHTLRVGADGKAEPIGAFERSWDTHADFTMQVYVSPTGNGFLLSTSLEEDLLFLSPAGTELRRVHCTHGEGVWPHNHLTTDPLALLVISDGGSRRTQLWLPLCQLLGPEEQRTGKVTALATATYEPVASEPWWTPPG